jgi:hypothetical protein
VSEEKIKELELDLQCEKSTTKELSNRILRAIEYLESYNTNFKHSRFNEAPISIRELGDLLEILEGKDKE